MESQLVIHMNRGEGETSYALNSGLQKMVASKAKRYVQDMVSNLYCKTFPRHKRLTIADMGCSSGPNTTTVISDIIDAIDEECCRLNQPLPEFQVFLNDLPGNDFNTLFNKYIPEFNEKLKKEKGDRFRSCCIAGVAGSFYGRIFPSNTLHFVHSLYGVHWLSQVPRGIESNEGNIYIAKTSPPRVLKAYLDQFQRDFSVFLSSRSEEIIVRGRMVITMLGRRSSDPYSELSGDTWNLLANSLRKMVLQGRIEEEKLNSFNIPLYMPSVEEVRAIIQSERSFEIDQLETFDVDWNCIEDDNIYGQNIAKCFRAIAEPILAKHFGHAVMDDLFRSFAEHIAEELVGEKAKLFNMVICMIKK